MPLNASGIRGASKPTPSRHFEAAIPTAETISFVPMSDPDTKKIAMAWTFLLSIRGNGWADSRTRRDNSVPYSLHPPTRKGNFK